MKRTAPGIAFENVTCIAATPKAILCIIDEDEVWIPQSQVHEDSEVFDNEDHSEGKLVITEWIAKEKGLL